MFNLINFLDKLGISKSTVSKALKRLKNESLIEKNKRTGRPKSLSVRAENSIIKEAIKHPFQSAMEVSKIYSKFSGKEISRQMVQRLLFKNNIKSYIAAKKPLITANQAKKRLKFAKSLQNKDASYWNDVIFSDESSIRINPGLAMQRVRRFSGCDMYDKKYIRPTTKFPTTVMVWACISAKGYGRLHICEGNMNSSQYIQVLESKLLSTIQDHGIQNPIFQQDSAPCHVSKKSKEWIANNEINLLDWPGYSPDLNPIENVWSVFKRKVALKVSKNKRELIENCIKVWNNEMPNDLSRKLISSMPDRLKSVIEKKGFSTKY